LGVVIEMMQLFVCSDGVLHVTCTEPTTNKSQDVLIESG